MGALDFVDYVDEQIEKTIDPRLTEYPLTTFRSQLILFSIYLSFVKVVGPYLMKNREPFSLRNVLIIYNLFQSLFCLYLLSKGLPLTYLGNYNFWCQPLVDPSHPDMPQFLQLCWLLYISKWIDCLDTIFFVLRKKYNQISFLHLFHHGVMPFVTGLGLIFVKSGHGAFPFVLNTFIHVIMYAYYMISALGPDYQRILNPYKRYLTIMQILQFVIIDFHGIQALIFGCNYPTFALFLEVFYGTVFLMLFCNFYYQAYIKNEKLTAKKR